jgi:uncharacterized protein YecA (UPF0149 family)
MKGDYRFKTPEIAERFLNEFMMLWNTLSAHQQEGNAFRFMRFSPAQSAEKIKARIFIRHQELKALMPLLEEAVPKEYENEFKAIAKPIKPASETIIVVLGALMTPSPNPKLAKWEQELDEMDAALEEAFNKLGQLLARMRRGNSVPEPSEVIADKNIGRNDLCPCGSGKKFMKCCWTVLN